jgi:hypothetical protein
MRAQVAWHVELAVKPGALEDFRARTGAMVEATRGGVRSPERRTVRQRGRPGRPRRRAVCGLGGRSGACMYVPVAVR